MALAMPKTHTLNLKKFALKIYISRKASYFSILPLYTVYLFHYLQSLVIKCHHFHPLNFPHF